jgi:hypothetical protein
MSVREMGMDNFNPLAWAGNIVSLGAIVGTFMGWLPAVAAVVAFTWYSIQIWESHTVQNWLHTRRERKIAYYTARVHQLRAQQKKRDPDLSHDDLRPSQ